MEHCSPCCGAVAVHNRGHGCCSCGTSCTGGCHPPIQYWICSVHPLKFTLYSAPSSVHPLQYCAPCIVHSTAHDVHSMLREAVQKETAIFRTLTISTPPPIPPLFDIPEVPYLCVVLKHPRPPPPLRKAYCFVWLL